MKFKAKYLLLPGLVILLFLTVFNFSVTDKTIAGDEAEGKIVYVDIQEVFDNHPDKEKAEKELNDMALSMQEELEEKAADLSEEEQKKILNEYQQQLSEKEQNLIQAILNDIDEAVKKTAEEKKVKMVLERKNVLYGGYDLTQDVISYIRNE